MRDEPDPDRKAFEAWVDNPHLTNRSNDPGTLSFYTNPWTAGAWRAWQEASRMERQRLAEPILGLIESRSAHTRRKWANALRGMMRGVMPNTRAETRQTAQEGNP
jgi:hypothetical protein